MTIPLFLESIKAGFPSPADDHLDKSLDINRFLVTHPEATFFLRVSGDSMIDKGIFPGDILVVDRSIIPQNEDIVIAAINNELTVKSFFKKNNKVSLVPANRAYKEIKISPEDDLVIWGTVISIIRKLKG